MSTENPERFQLGPWLIEPTLGRAAMGETEVSLRPKEMDLLLYLAKNQGRVVSVDDIFANVWEGVEVSNDALYFSISQLRKSLDLADDSASIVETIPKRGYRLTQVVDFFDEAETSGLTDSSEESHNLATAAPKSRRFKIAPLVAGAVVLLVAAMWFAYVQMPYQDSDALVNVNSIAVLPFVDLSPGRDHAYFSDGITEEILSRLTHVQGLYVAARTSSFSFKGSELDIVDIGKALGVASILEGSIRKDGDLVKISVQLVDATTGFQLWSNTYERELSSVFAIQIDISQRIIDALHVTLDAPLKFSGDPKDRVMNPLVLEEYLLGLESLRNNSFQSLNAAADHFNTALALNPSFHKAGVRLAETKLAQLATGATTDMSLVVEAEALLLDALRDNPDDAGAHRILAKTYNWQSKRDESERELQAALALAPSDSDVLVQLAQVRMSRGDVQESLNLVRRAIRLDPFGSEPLTFYGRTQARLGQPKDASESYLKAIDLHPGNPNFPWLRGKLQVGELGEISDGLVSFLKAAEIDQNDYEIAAYVAMTYLSLEMFDAAEPWIKRANTDGRGTITTSALNAIFYALTGQGERAAELSVAAVRSRKERFGAHAMLTKSLLILAGGHLIENGMADEAVTLFEEASPLQSYIRNKTLHGNVAEARLALNDIPKRWLVAKACAYDAAGLPGKASQMLAYMKMARIGTVDKFRAQLRTDDYLVEAEALTLEGDTDAALATLEKALAGNLYFNWQIEIQNNHAFTDLREEPRFLALVESIKQKIHREREFVLEREKYASVSTPSLGGFDLN